MAADKCCRASSPVLLSTRPIQKLAAYLFNFNYQKAKNMSQPTKAQSRRASHDIAKELFEMEKPFKDLQEKREALKASLREFGPQEYIFDGGVVKVGEPEVRTFKGQTFELVPTKFVELPQSIRFNLLELGAVVPKDVYTRNAVSKVETTLT